MSSIRVLLVDDDDVVRMTVAEILKRHEFEVTVAANVPDALKEIASKEYDVLLSDLHMPGAGDGLTVVSAMKHSNPKAITMLLSAFPALDRAAEAIMAQPDEVLLKPVDVTSLVEAVKHRLASGPTPARKVETVATILLRSFDSTIEDWYRQVKNDETLLSIPLSFEMRAGHLPKVLQDLVVRLQSSKELGTKEMHSAAAAEHGFIRRQQGYTAAMMVEESRMLQLSIFRTLQKNLANIDFSVVLVGVMTIADEVDSQLSQAMTTYIAESAVDELPY